jgi:hypothetical protein
MGVFSQAEGDFLCISFESPTKYRETWKINIMSLKASNYIFLLLGALVS